MSDATETRKDELAARMLLELEKPAIPEGLAARIAARATAEPQIGATGAVHAPNSATAMLASESVSVLNMPVKGRARPVSPRWRGYAAASAVAVVLVSVGLLAGGRDAPGDAPVVAEADSPPQRTPVSDADNDGEKLAEAVPRKAKAIVRAPKAVELPAPAMTLPIALTPPPTELAHDEKPDNIAPPEMAPQERLAQTVPQSIPQGGGGAISIYGPPAPSGLGIAGSVPGQSGLPSDQAQPSRGPRGTSLGPPPSSLPGSSLPRGPRLRP
jgi:hypothetical protein